MNGFKSKHVAISGIFVKIHLQFLIKNIKRKKIIVVAIGALFWTKWMHLRQILMDI